MGSKSWDWKQPRDIAVDIIEKPQWRIITPTQKHESRDPLRIPEQPSSLGTLIHRSGVQTTTTATITHKSTTLQDVTVDSATWTRVCGCSESTADVLRKFQEDRKCILTGNQSFQRRCSSQDRRDSLYASLKEHQLQVDCLEWVI